MSIAKNDETKKVYRTINGKDYHLFANCKKINSTSFKIDKESAALLFSPCEACKKQKNYSNTKAKSNKGFQGYFNYNSLLEKEKIAFENKFYFNDKKEEEQEIKIRYQSSYSDNNLDSHNNSKAEIKNVYYNNYNKSANSKNKNERLSLQENENIIKLVSELIEKKFDDFSNKNLDEKVKLICNPLLNTVNELKIKLMQIEDKLNNFEIEELKRKEFEMKIISLESLTDDLKMLCTKVESVSERCFANEKLFDSIDFKFIELENKILNFFYKRESELEKKKINNDLSNVNKKLLELEIKIDKSLMESESRKVKVAYDFYGCERQKIIEQKLLKIEETLNFKVALNKVNKNKLNVLFDASESKEKRNLENLNFCSYNNNNNVDRETFPTNDKNKIKRYVCNEVKPFMKEMNERIIELEAFKHNTSLILDNYNNKTQTKFNIVDSLNNESETEQEEEEEVKEICKKELICENDDVKTIYNNENENQKAKTFNFKHINFRVKDKMNPASTYINEETNIKYNELSIVPIKKKKVFKLKTLAFNNNNYKNKFNNLLFYNFKRLPQFLSLFIKNISDLRRMYNLKHSNKYKQRRIKLISK